MTSHEMPRLTGLELAVKARFERMKLPIIMASGLANTLGCPQYEWLNLTARLQKPFAPGQLLATVKQVLQAASNVPCERRHLATEISEALRRITPYRHWGLNE